MQAVKIINLRMKNRNKIELFKVWLNCTVWNNPILNKPLLCCDLMNTDGFDVLSCKKSKFARCDVKSLHEFLDIIFCAVLCCDCFSLEINFIDSFGLLHEYRGEYRFSWLLK